VIAPSQRQDLGLRPWPEAPSPHRSFWLRQALAQDGGARIEPLGGDQRFDVCIIGGGFTGLWTALRLRERDAGLSIAIVEADVCGAGASGRNSGGTGHWWSKAPILLRALGSEDGAYLLDRSVAILDDMRSYIAAHEIDCQLRREPAAWTTTTQAQVGGWNAVFAAAGKLDRTPPYRILDKEELRERFGTGPFFTGVVEDAGTRIQPALLARALRRQAIRQGIRIFERSPVTRILSRDLDVLVEGRQGSIVAGQIVLAANAWMAHLPAFRARTMVVSSEIVITEPIGDIVRERGLAHRPGGVTSSQMLNYGGYTPDGRVYVGGAGGTMAFRSRIGPEFDYSARAVASVKRDFAYLYPELHDVPVVDGWSGPIDRSASGFPMVGRLDDPRIHYAIGFTGHGVSATAMAGHAIAGALLDIETPWTHAAALLQRMTDRIFPPEPLRYVAGRVVRRSVARKELAERDARLPSWWDRKLAPAAVATWRASSTL
jgi:glycine/D-amino acid oxidase-like deaminating enzyme